MWPPRKTFGNTEGKEGNGDSHYWTNYLFVTTTALPGGPGIRETAFSLQKGSTSANSHMSQCHFRAGQSLGRRKGRLSLVSSDLSAINLDNHISHCDLATESSRTSGDDGDHYHTPVLLCNTAANSSRGCHPSTLCTRAREATPLKIRIIIVAHTSFDSQSTRKFSRSKMMPKKDICPSRVFAFAKAKFEPSLFRRKFRGPGGPWEFRATQLRNYADGRGLTASAFRQIFPPTQME